MSRHGLVFVEGTDDAVVLSRILQLKGAEELPEGQWEGLSFLDAEGKRKGGRRITGTEPSVWALDGWRIGIQPVRGEGELAPDTVDIVGARDPEELQAVGVITDADDDADASFMGLRQPLQDGLEDWPAFSDLDEPGMVRERDGTRAGIFVWPNNSDDGCLEDLVADAWRTTELDLWTAAEHYLLDEQPKSVDAWGECKRLKGVLSAAGAAVTPGVSNSHMLASYEPWLTRDVLNTAEWIPISTYLSELFEI